MNEHRPKTQLNIKSERGYNAAVELSELTGESLTSAVIAAIEERLERERRKAGREDMVERLMDLGRRYSALPDKDTRTADEILGYDENGLPT